MIDLLPDILSHLTQLDAPVRTLYPADFTQLPCIVLTETANDVFARADGAPHLHEVEYTLESWASALSQTHALAAKLDEKLSALGFSRTYCCDLFDAATRAHRRVMRYRALCDEHRIITQ